MIKEKVCIWSNPFTKYFSKDLADNKRSINIVDYSESQTVPISYMYTLPQYKNMNIKIRVGQMEYRIRKILEKK